MLFDSNLFDYTYPYTTCERCYKELCASNKRTGGTHHETKTRSGTESKNFLNLCCYTYISNFDSLRR